MLSPHAIGRAPIPNVNERKSPKTPDDLAAPFNAIEHALFGGSLLPNRI